MTDTPIKAMIEEAKQAIVEADRNAPDLAPDRSDPIDMLTELEAKAALRVFIRRVLREPTPEMVQGLTNGHSTTREKLAMLADYIDKEIAE